MTAFLGILWIALIVSVMTIGAVVGTAGCMYGVFKAIEYVMDRI